MVLLVFVEGPAKATWQSTLSAEVHGPWLSIAKIFQHLAPDKLLDANLESILWNKVPVALQKEVGELKEW